MLSVWEGLEDSDLGLVEDLDDLTLLRGNGDSLGDDLNSLLLGILLGSVVLLDSLNERFVASRLANVFDSDVDSLAELLATMSLGDLNTNS